MNKKLSEIFKEMPYTDKTDKGFIQSVTLKNDEKKYSLSDMESIAQKLIKEGRMPQLEQLISSMEKAAQHAQEKLQQEDKKKISSQKLRGKFKS